MIIKANVVRKQGCSKILAITSVSEVGDVFMPEKLKNGDVLLHRMDARPQLNRDINL